LDQQQVQEVKQRVEKMFEWRQSSDSLLSIALEQLILGRTCLLEIQQRGEGDIPHATEVLQRAVEGLRQAGQLDQLPRGLLVRAELYRFTRDFERAERYLNEVLRISTRSGMGLNLADCHLESARLQIAQGNKEKAREHWTTAREMIERMGYHRRDKDVEEIAAQLS
jgi:tetratricopeptide (TPR) repeat protein